MTTRGSHTISWDVENRVISVSGGASFVYNGDCNRVKKTENSETILYINQYYEKNITTGVVTTYYYLGGQLVANRQGTTLTYIHKDSLNSTSVVTNSSGAQTETIKYFPFVECRSGSVSTDKKFTGQRLDETGLYYYSARYYDAGIGRFISADSVAQSPGNPQTLNRYAYCLNNPLKYTDPCGHSHVAECDGAWDIEPDPPNPPSEPPKQTEPDIPLEDGENTTESTDDKCSSENVVIVIETWDAIEGGVATGLAIPCGFISIGTGTVAIINAGTLTAEIGLTGTAAIVTTGALVVSGTIIATAGVVLIVGAVYVIWEI